MNKEIITFHILLYADGNNIMCSIRKLDHILSLLEPYTSYIYAKRFTLDLMPMLVHYRTWDHRSYDYVHNKYLKKLTKRTYKE